MQLSAHRGFVLFAVLAHFPCGAAAQTGATPERSAEAQLRVYTDSDHVTVITPSATARGPLGGPVSVDVTATVDIVSAASVDVTSQASPRGFTDRRYEGDVGLTWAATPHVAFTARAIGSIENDYRSIYAGGALHLDLAQHNAFVDLSYMAAFDTVGRAGDPTFAMPRRAQRLVASYTQVLGPRTLLDLVADGEYVSGYQASPYRYVPIYDAMGDRLYSLAEAVPDERWRGALLARIRRAFAQGAFFLHADYRYYLDDWGVQSHTATARGLLPVAHRRVTLAAELRGYLQGAANFYKSTYVDDGGGAPAWRTRDRALGRTEGVSTGLVVDAALGRRGALGGPHALLSATWLRWWWPDFPLQTQRDALLVSASASMSW